MAETEREFTQDDVEALRVGDWIIVKLAGEVVLRRLTRDQGFTTAWVVFAGNRSPDYPKIRQHFESVELRGNWRLNHRLGYWLRNRIEVPIIESEVVV